MIRTPLAIALASSLAMGLAACRPQPIVIQAPDSPEVAHAKAEAAEKHTLSVSGLATMQVAPDRLDLHIQLREQHRRPDKVIALIRSRQAALETAIDKAGLAKVERITSRLDLHEQYERRDNENIKVGYRATVSLTISMEDFDEVGTFMQLGAENGAESMSTQFRSTKLSEKKMEVRAKAVEAARAKAEQLASLSGTKLGAVVTLQEGDFRDVYWGRTQVSNAVIPVAASDTRRLGDAQELSIQVTIGYRLLSS